MTSRRSFLDFNPVKPLILTQDSFQPLSYLLHYTYGYLYPTTNTMKHFIKFILPVAAAFGVFAFVASAATAHAASNSLWFQPGGGSYSTGQTFTITVYGSADSNFGAPSTNVTVKYPGALLSVTGMAKGTTLPNATLAHDSQAQTITFAQTVFFGASAGFQNAPLFTITFQAKTAGAATLDFTNYFLAGHTVAKTPSTYSIADPVCPAGQVGTPPNCSTPAPSIPSPSPSPASTPTAQPLTSSPAPTQQTTPQQDSAPQAATPVANPEISDDTADARYDSTTIQWKATNTTTTTLKYGLSKEILDNTAEVVAGDSESYFKTSLMKLQLGTTYYYQIDAKNSSDQVATTQGSFTTKAYPVTIRVIQGTTPVSGASITLSPQSTRYTSDNKGEVKTTLKPGDYTVRIKKDSLDESQKFTVKALAFTPGSTPDTQIISITLAAPTALAAAKPAPNILPGIVGGFLLLILSGGGVGLLLWRRRQKSQAIIGYQSIIDDVPPGPVYSAPALPEYPIDSYQPGHALQQSDAIPTTYYGEPAPTYDSGAQADSYPTPTDIPVNSQSSALNLPDPEPSDIWASPSVYTQDFPAPTPPPVDQPLPNTDAPEPQPTPLYPEQELNYSQHPEAPAEPYATASPIETDAPQYIPPQPTLASEESYEYNEDNSMTIHHAR